MQESRYSIDSKKYPDSSAVWRVENPETGQHCFVGGFAHLLTPKDLPLPSPYYAAYNESEVIVFETIPGQSFGLVSKIIMAVRLSAWVEVNINSLKYPKGDSLESHVSQETLQILRKAWGDDYSKNIRLTPLGLDFLLFKNDDDTGAEEAFHAQGISERKKFLALDDAEIHGSVIKVLKLWKKTVEDDIEESGMDATVLDIVSDDGSEPNLSEADRRGHLRGMEKEFAIDNKAYSFLGEELTEELLTERNQKWVDKISKMLKRNSPEVECIFVGAAHLFGEHGLIRLMKDKGWKLQQLYGIDRP